MIFRIVVALTFTVSLAWGSSSSTAATYSSATSTKSSTTSTSSTSTSSSSSATSAYSSSALSSVSCDGPFRCICSVSVNNANAYFTNWFNTRPRNLSGGSCYWVAPGGLGHNMRTVTSFLTCNENNRELCKEYNGTAPEVPVYPYPTSQPQFCVGEGPPPHNRGSYTTTQPATGNVQYRYCDLYAEDSVTYRCRSADDYY